MIEFVGPTPNRWPRALNDFRYRTDHTTEGGYDGSLAWLLNPASSVAAHFVVREDGHIAQLCDLRDAPWHAGITFAPSTPLYDGTNPNLVSVGVEFAGTYLKALTQAQLDASMVIDEMIRSTFGVATVPHVAHSMLATGGPNMRRDPGDANFTAILAMIQGGDDLYGDADRQRDSATATAVRDLWDKVNALATNIPFVWLERLALGQDPSTGAPLPLKAAHVAALKKAAKEAHAFVKEQAKTGQTSHSETPQKGEWPGPGPEPVASEREAPKKMVRKTTRIAKEKK